MKTAAYGTTTIEDCKCPQCGEPSAGFKDALGAVDLTCYKCTMAAARLKGHIVEKVVVNLASGCKTHLFALATSEPTAETKTWSLTFEAYLSDWTPFRAALKGKL